MSKILAVLIAGLFSVGAYAAEPKKEEAKPVAATAAKKDDAKQAADAKKDDAKPAAKKEEAKK
jgi:short subunit fatty acids transporter